MAARGAVVIAAACLLLGAAGCGEDAGVADGATVTAYVDAPLCASAKRELATTGSEAGSVQVEAVCLPSPRSGTRLNLAMIGANARRASEDSSSIAVLEADDPAANRFSRPILEAAGIAWISSDSGAAAMKQLLRAVAESDSDSLRDSVRESLNPT
jgi:hypothetical protein